MLIGRIRPSEIREFTIEGDNLEQVRADVRAAVPSGWDLTDAPLEMGKGFTTFTSRAKMARRDEPTDIEADDLDALIAKVPDGYQLLSVRAV
jgi:hypothetical protein